MEFIFQGYLSVKDDHEGHETVFLNGEALVDALCDLHDEIVSVRYYIAEKEADYETLKKDYLLKTLYGECYGEYQPQYTEITGYVGTTDTLLIGGHDLREELDDYDGKFLYLLAKVEKESSK